MGRALLIVSFMALITLLLYLGSYDSRIVSINDLLIDIHK